MDLACVSVHGSRLGLPLFEQVSYPRDELPDSLKRLRADAAADQLFLLSTCERTELYAVWPDRAEPTRLLDALCADRGVAPALLGRAASQFQAGDAARHLFRVAAGLESFILGETDILAQVKAASAATREAGTNGHQLDRLVATATHTARRVHRQTALGAGGHSMAATAVQAAARHAGSLAGRSVVVVGAGHVAAAMVDAAEAAGAEVTVCNRTRRHASRFVAIGATVLDFTALSSLVGSADVLVFATAAPHPLLDAAQLQAWRDPGAGSLVILDLCVPRNVDPAVRDVVGAQLLDLTDLRDTGVQDTDSLTRDFDHAESIVDDEVARFLRWLSDRAVAASVQQLRRDLEACAEQELQRLQRELPAELQVVVEQRFRRVVRRLAHRPTQRLLDAAASGDDDLVRLLGGLFAD